jgi:hypothetical protein
VSFKVLAEQQLSTTAVEAFTAEFGVVCTDSLSYLEALYVLAHAGNDADGLVAGDEREFGEEFALVDVKVGAADAAGFNFDEHIVVSKGGKVDFDDAVLFWLRVSVGEMEIISQMRIGSPERS